MKKQIRSYIFVAALICADIWNILSLTQVLPFDRWRFSFAISGVGILIMLIPQFFRTCVKSDAAQAEAPRKSTVQDKLLFGTMIGSFALLAITWIACIVYPL